jgi:hypothetical protein
MGFYGNDGIGSPIVVGGFNGRTFVTDPSGTIHGFEANNNKRISSSGLIYGQIGSGINLLQLPNTLATLNLRFSHTSSVSTQSAAFYVYDGTLSDGVPNKNNDPSGLTAWCAEVRKTDNKQDVSNGLGDSTWQDIHGSTSLSLISSPGTSGLRPDGSFTVDTRHDWYIAMSVSPDEFGDKVFGILMEVEFL